MSVKKKSGRSQRAGRARVLREQVESRLRPASAAAKPPENESPHAFVERRMRELAEAERREKRIAARKRAARKPTVARAKPRTSRTAARKKRSAGR